ncbi:MAG: hypothetical protein AAGD00_11355 [Planctomycetota bacterium]
MRTLTFAIALTTSLTMLAPAFAASAQDGADAESGKTWVIRRPPSSQRPPAVAEPARVNLGHMFPGDVRETEVILSNPSETPVRIKEVRSTCWCTAGEPDSFEIPGGGFVSLDVRVEAPDVRETLGRAVIVIFEGFAQPLVIDVDAEVNRGIRTQYVSDDANVPQVGAMTLESQDGTAFEVLSVNGEAPVFLDDTSDDGTRHRLRIDFSNREEEDVPRYVLVETTHETAPIIDVELLTVEREVAQRQRRPWGFASGRVYLGTVNAGKPTFADVLVRGWPSDPFEAVRDVAIVNGAEADVHIVGMKKVENDTMVRLMVRTPKEARGVLDVRLMISAIGHDGELSLVGRLVSGES